MQDGIQVHAVILSAAPAGEADRRIVLLTKELGKVSVFARGARRPTSAFVGATRPFSYGVFTIAQGRSAYSLVKAEISEYFEEISQDVEKSAYAFSFCEFAGYFARENADETGTLSLLYLALRALLSEKMPMRLIQLAFECRILSENGLFPAFSSCAMCRKPLVSGRFLKSLMQPVCEGCRKEEEGLFLPRSALYALEYIRTAPLTRLFGFTVTDEVLSRMLPAAEIIVHNAIDRELPARKMLGVLTGN